MTLKSPIGRLAILVGGGPAPGINGVIGAVTMEAINRGMEVIGLRDGFKWLALGDGGHNARLTAEDVNGIQLRGGSILGTSRVNPAKSPETMKKALKLLQDLEIACLVTIGGDDTAYSASEVYRQAAGSIRVAHVPKTIDNDLPLPGSAPTFGYETARHFGALLLRHLAEDAKTTSRWYLVVTMGRSTGHLALGIGKSGAATLTVIPEEFRGAPVTLGAICDVVIGAIIKRKSRGLNHGAVVLAEGLMEAIGEAHLAEELRNYGEISRDPHGHLRLCDIHFGHLMNDVLSQQVKELNIDTAFVDKELGYELRAADPVPFDVEYTRDLGYGAVQFIHSTNAENYGAIIGLVDGHIQTLPFDTVIDPHTRSMSVRQVNVDEIRYESGRRSMDRLELEDLEDVGRLRKLADVIGWTPERFRARFEHVVAHR